MTTNRDRHAILIDAGWTYDPAEAYYTAPNAPSDGTATRYNEEAAWNMYQSMQAGQQQRQAAPPKRSSDPREQEPK